MDARPLHGSGIIDTTTSPYSKMWFLPLGKVSIPSGFWSDRIQTGRDRGLPRLYELLEEHGVIDNFLRLRGREEVARRGPLFTDSDLFKWMEAAAFAIWTHPDPDLESLLESVIDEVIGVQGPDGYLNTYFVEDRADDRFSSLDNDHELYCAGHLIQAAIAHYRATGGRKLLDCAMMYADYLVSAFGPGRKRGFCGHPELEMAMVELFRTEGKGEYLDFAGYLLEGIGFSSRTSLEGHAVRAGYACCGGADFFLETGDSKTLTALDALWTDLAGGKVFITGGIGSRYVQEAFGEPYELPNLGAYAETCAAISNAMWNWRMLSATGDCKYTDMLETVLYNGFLSGVSLSGDRYFYMNPLESSGSPGDGERGHRRMEWYSCTCCPTNVQRTLASLPGYVYGRDGNSIWINLFQSSRLTDEIFSTGISIGQDTKYPWDGEVKISVDPDSPMVFGVKVRIPGWVSKYGLTINGEDMEKVQPGQYLSLEREWARGDLINLTLDMPVRFVDAHPRVREDFGCASIGRGPIVYCVESVDNPDIEVQDLMLSGDPEPVFEFRPDLLGGIGVVKFEALVSGGGGPLYGPLGERELGLEPVEATAIPYYAWGNRGKSSMLVWLPLAPAQVRDVL